PPVRNRSDCADLAACLATPGGGPAGGFAIAAAGSAADSGAVRESFAPERPRALGAFASAGAKDCSRSGAAGESESVAREAGCGSAHCYSGTSLVPRGSFPGGVRPIAAANWVVAYPQAAVLWALPHEDAVFAQEYSLAAGK